MTMFVSLVVTTGVRLSVALLCDHLYGVFMPAKSRCFNRCRRFNGCDREWLAAGY